LGGAGVGGARARIRGEVFLRFLAVRRTLSAAPSPAAAEVATATARKAGRWKGERTSALSAPVSAKEARTNSRRRFPTFRRTRAATTARAGGTGGGGGDSKGPASGGPLRPAARLSGARARPGGRPPALAGRPGAAGGGSVAAP